MAVRAENLSEGTDLKIDFVCLEKHVRYEKLQSTVQYSTVQYSRALPNRPVCVVILTC